jgi:hypothetical protein
VICVSYVSLRVTCEFSKSFRHAPSVDSKSEEMGLFSNGIGRECILTGWSGGDITYNIRWGREILLLEGNVTLHIRSIIYLFQLLESPYLSRHSSFPCLSRTGISTIQEQNLALLSLAFLKKEKGKNYTPPHTHCDRSYCPSL